MPFVKVASLARLHAGDVMEARIGQRAIAVCNSGGRIFAVDGTCPHAGGPLGHGALHDTMLVCPFHAWEFDCRTGEHDFNPAIRVDTYAVRVDGDDILVDLDQHAGTA